MNGFLPRAARLLGAPLILLAGVRCAHVEAPSGGPVDATPPAVAAVYPAPGAVGVPTDARVLLQFTEWIDRNATRGTAMISPPYAGRVRVEVDGDRLIVRPPAGQTLRPATTHTITVLGTLKDLRGNSMGEAFSLRFSTGPSLDSAGFEGTLSLEGRRGPLLVALYHLNDRAGRVGALSPRDTGFTVADAPEPWRELPAFLAGADSLGRFVLDGVVPGDYGVFAFEDLNGNFAFDVGLESGATGEPSLALQPRAAAQSLRLAPMDTLPLRVTEVSFIPDSGGTEIMPAGVVLVKFGRPAHPVRAIDVRRYVVVPDSGEAVAVTGAGWSPALDAWILETPPLRAGVRHRLVMLTRPDFPGRYGAENADTSVAFDVATFARDTTKKAAWTLAPLRSGGGLTGLLRAATAPGTEPRQAFASNLPLTPARWSILETRLEARTRRPNDTTAANLPHQLLRLGPLSFVVQWGNAIRPGDALELRLRSPAGDTAPPLVLYAGTVPDTAQFARLKIMVPSERTDWVFWAQPAAPATTAAPALYPLRRIAGDSLESAPLPRGRYIVHGFHDRDGDGVWNPGALRPWIPQEAYETLPDTVTVGR